jgi:hypothetical protein
MRPGARFRIDRNHFLGVRTSELYSAPLPHARVEFKVSPLKGSPIESPAATLRRSPGTKGMRRRGTTLTY